MTFDMNPKCQVKGQDIISRVILNDHTTVLKGPTVPSCSTIVLYCSRGLDCRPVYLITTTNLNPIITLLSFSATPAIHELLKLQTPDRNILTTKPSLSQPNQQSLHIPFSQKIQQVLPKPLHPKPYLKMYKKTSDHYLQPTETTTRS